MTETTTTPTVDSSDATLNRVRSLVKAWLVTWDNYPPSAVVRWKLPIEEAIDDTIAGITAGEVQLGDLLEEFARHAAGWLADAKHAERQLDDAAVTRTKRDGCYCDACDFVCNDDAWDWEAIDV
jgi:hypothetical protein